MLIRSFDEAVRLLHDRINLERLQSFAPQDMEGRLDLLRDILIALDNPERDYRTVHVTGTKGKGSTCVMLESMLLEAGDRVGRFTSPHLYSFTERLMIDGIPCPPDEFTELFFFVYEQIEPNVLQSLTYFEMLTLLAFVYFSRQKVDAAVFEVGLGGRLDATNLCRPDVSVITSISYDHMAQLGPTLSDIAAEKSGIIKPGVPVVTTVRQPEPLTVIRGKAQSLGSPLFVLDEHFFVRNEQPTTSQYTFRYDARLPEEWPLDNISPKMPGKHQIINASAAITAFLLLQRKNIFATFAPTLRSLRLENLTQRTQRIRKGRKANTKETIKTGLQQAFIPLRFEIVRPNDESPTFIFDGAHNRASMQAFVQTVREMFPNRRLLLIFGASLGKDAEGMFAEIDGHFHHVFLTQSSESTRRYPPQKLRSIFSLPEMNITIVENCMDAWEQCVQMADKEDVICITGSLYLAAELRKCFAPAE